jgi:hypothetical protein
MIRQRDRLDMFQNYFLFSVLGTLVFYRDKPGSPREECDQLIRTCFHSFLEFSEFTGLSKRRRPSSRRGEPCSRAGTRKVSIFFCCKKGDTDVPLDGLLRKRTLPHTTAFLMDRLFAPAPQC